MVTRELPRATPAGDGIQGKMYINHRQLVRLILQYRCLQCFKAVPTIFLFKPFCLSLVAFNKIELTMELRVEKNTMTQCFYLLLLPSLLVPKIPLCLELSSPLQNYSQAYCV